MKYSTRIYTAVQEFYSENYGVIATWDDIDKMSKREVLDSFLKWEGIFGYTDYIYDIYMA